MGNRNRKNTLDGIIGCLSSFALAFSLFAMPAMAWASQPSGEDVALEPVEGEAALIDQAQDEQGANDEPTAAEAEDAAIEGIDEQPEEELSILDSIFQFFANISPFSVSPESMQDASLAVTLNTLVPKAAQAAGNDLTLTVRGTSGGGDYTAKFAPKATTYENFITDVHGSADSAQVYADAPTQFVAQIAGIPAGTYTIEVTGRHYGKYTHGASVSLRDGDRAELSLVDSLYGGSIPAGEQRVGLVPFGDFNRDDAVNDADSALIAEAVHGKSANLIFDLTGDGSVDLADVQHFASTVNQTHAATELRITKDSAQMGSSFMEGTSAFYKPAGSSTPTQDPDQAANSLFFNDGDTIILRHHTGANISDETPVGFTVEPKGAEIAAFAVQFPVDENNDPYNMGDGGRIILNLQDPVPGENESDKVYTLRADIVEATGDIAQLIPSGNPDEHPYDFMYDRVKAYLHKDTGQLIVVFADSVVPVTLQSAEVVFTSTTDPTRKSIEISHVEFLNSVADINTVSLNSMAAPRVLSLETGDEEIALAWTPQQDALTYDVEVGIDNQTDVYTVSTPSLLVDGHSSTGALQNEKPYQLRVRSVGLKGNSVWSEPVTAVPEDRTAPSDIPAPALTAGYSQITASWDAVDNADSYLLYFKKAGSQNYASAELAATSYTVKNLDPYTEYEFCLAAQNEYGISDASEVATASTTSAGGKVPWFNLTNRASQNADLYPSVNTFASVEVADLGSDEAWAAVDGNFDTYVALGSASEATGGTNATVSAAFNEAQSIRALALTTYLGEGYANDVENVFVRAFGKDDSGEDYTTDVLTLESGLVLRSVPTEGGADTGSVNTIYVELPYALHGVQKLNVSFTRVDGAPATVSELAFYAPSGLEEAIAGIWADDTHLTLADGIDEAALNDLVTRIESTDAASAENGHGAEKHPLFSEFAATIEAARQVLDFDDPITVGVNTSITTANAILGGLNAWQPLGITAKPGDALKVYVNTPTASAGEPTKLRLIASQYLGTQDSQFLPVGYLLSGMNEITIPEVGNLEGINVERGGALYLEYTGDPASDSYDVSVLGGTRIPVLDLTGLTDDAQLRSERIMGYVTELEEYVNTLSQVHGDAGHAGTGFFGMFVDTDCIANITEIVTDHAVLTLPATKVVLDMGSPDLAAVTDRIDTITKTTDAMIDLAYQHKGTFRTSENPNLSATFGINNDMPAARHNIRCMNVDDGTGLCLAANYIGIPWDGVSDILSTGGVRLATDGSYEEGGYLGAVIAHGLGHQLSDNASALPEVTANYFTQLLTATDTNDSIVFDWNDVLGRVTSDAMGDLDARLGAACLWQLHLAYDVGLSHTTYADPDDQMANLVFARMNAYARNVDDAPYGLSLEGVGANDKFMRLACAAADRNLIDFFEAWGLAPSDGTRAYASHFRSEERAIQYLTDESAKAARAGVGVGVDKLEASLQASFDKDAQLVHLTDIKAGGVSAKNVRGFEVLRSVSGEPYQAVGFVAVSDGSFSEDAALLPEDDVTYQVRAVDNAGNVSAASEAATVHVDHTALQGGVANFTMPSDKSRWTITTNMDATEGAAHNASDADIFDAMGCGSASGTDLSAVIDGDVATAFSGNVPYDTMAHQLTIAFNDTIDVSGIRYYPGNKEKSFKGIDIEVSSNGSDWTLVDSSMLYFPKTDNYKGYDAFDKSDNAVIYFAEDFVSGNSADADKLATYRASYLRITEWADNPYPISIAEIDVVSAPIYHVSLLDESEHFGMGKLTEDATLTFESGEGQLVIPKGSFVIMGDYTGNPVYNTIVVKDQFGNAIVDPAKQLIITGKVGQSDAALVDATAMVRQGKWLYFFEPGTYEDMLEEWGDVHPELYRSDASASLSGAKLVSVGSAAAIQRQGINEAMDVDLFGITLDLGSYDAHR